MKRQDIKSQCPINFTVEVFGDPWSLLIVREIASFGALTFGHFLQINELISTSVFADRLEHLQHRGIITKRQHATDKRKTEYALTPLALDALPILYEVAAWGSRNSSEPAAPESWFAALELDKQTVLAAWRKSLESGSAFFRGPQSVVNQLHLEGAK
ncbi:MAG TPA: helix-turn-helix domain-containing protein [Candidatus Saccharimonadales bacterium]|nr:helix-turn-helix domain-containing protein [Candidatus Saccharimonadales bacterium]